MWPNYKIEIKLTILNPSMKSLEFESLMVTKSLLNSLRHYMWSLFSWIQPGLNITKPITRKFFTMINDIFGGPHLYCPEVIFCPLFAFWNIHVVMIGSCNPKIRATISLRILLEYSKPFKVIVKSFVKDVYFWNFDGLIDNSFDIEI